MLQGCDFLSMGMLFLKHRVGEDDTKGKHGLRTTTIYELIWIV